MKKYIEADGFVKAMEGYRGTYGRAARKYAGEHAVEAVAVGDPLDGCVIEVAREDDGRMVSRLKACTGNVEELWQS